MLKEVWKVEVSNFTISNWAREKSWNILKSDVDAFCPCPKTLPKAILKILGPFFFYLFFVSISIMLIL